MRVINLYIVSVTRIYECCISAATYEMVETATNGVRSGITPQDTEDVQSHPTGSVVTHRAVRMSLRPPARFTEKADFALWIKISRGMYLRQKFQMRSGLASCFHCWRTSLSES